MFLLNCCFVCCAFVLSLSLSCLVFTLFYFSYPASNLVIEEFRGRLNSHIQYHMSEFLYWSWHELIYMIEDGMSGLSKQELLINNRGGHWVTMLK